MRDIIPNLNKEFILGIIAENKRFDGRQPTDMRQIKVEFGESFGTCEARIGDTRVQACVSGEVGCPKSRRPNEGVLHVNLDMSPMAHPSFEPGRQTDETICMNQLLERCLKNSGCIDLESLCIVAGEKVWVLRVDIVVLNHAGNILDCCSIAAMAALKHFRRLDVTVIGEEVTIHTAEERDPIPLSVHHMPLCVTFAFFHEGTHQLVDPTEQEEQVMEGRMHVGMNKHREICLLLGKGQMAVDKNQVMRCTKMAQVKVVEMTDLILQALANDKAARARGERWGFAVSAEPEKINSTAKAATEVEAPPPTTSDLTSDSDSASDSDAVHSADSGDNSYGDAPRRMGQGVAVLGESAVEQWRKGDRGDSNR